MIVYKDRAFCSAACGNCECYRCVTPEIRAGADKTGLPFWFMDFKDGDDCPGWKPIEGEGE